MLKEGGGRTNRLFWTDVSQKLIIKQMVTNHNKEYIKQDKIILLSTVAQNS